MDILEAIDALKSGQFVKTKDYLNNDIFYVLGHIEPIGSDEVLLFEVDDMEYRQSRPTSFKEIPWAHRDTVNMNAVVSGDFTISSKEEVLEAMQKAWDKYHA